jgi:hypothetical protein
VVRLDRALLLCRPQRRTRSGRNLQVTYNPEANPTTLG